MRHRKANKTLTANTNYTEALLYNMTLSLITHKRIKTTLVRAKALRSYVEKLITIAKKSGDDTSKFRLLMTKLRSNTDLVKSLKEVSEAYIDRPGGYTRVLKTGTRFGDNAKTALIELV